MVFVWFLWHGHRELSWLHTQELPPRACPPAACGVTVSGLVATKGTQKRVLSSMLCLKCWAPPPGTCFERALPGLLCALGTARKQERIQVKAARGEHHLVTSSLRGWGHLALL